MEVFSKINKNNWLEVFSASVGQTIVLQERAAKYVVKERDWWVNFKERYISFGDDKYPIQFIGSESFINNTWMWGWNNINNFSEEIIKISNETFEKGSAWGLTALTDEQFEIDGVYNGHTLSMVACALNEENYFYYRAPHGSGAVFLAIENMPKDMNRPMDVAEFQRVVSDTIQRYDMEHKIFVESLLQWNRTRYDVNEDILTANFNVDICIKFKKNENGINIIDDITINQDNFFRRVWAKVVNRIKI